MPSHLASKWITKVLNNIWSKIGDKSWNRCYLSQVAVIKFQRWSRSSWTNPTKKSRLKSLPRSISSNQTPVLAIKLIRKGLLKKSIATLIIKAPRIQITNYRILVTTACRLIQMYSTKDRGVPHPRQESLWNLKRLTNGPRSLDTTGRKRGWLPFRGNMALTRSKLPVNFSDNLQRQCRAYPSMTFSLP